LALLQATGYVVQFVTLPYLTRVLGPEEWGRVAWMQVILTYFGILTEWGFSWNGVRKLAALRNDRARLSESFFASWSAQWMLCAGALGMLGALSSWAPFFAPFRAYTLAGMGVIVAGVLFPLWLLIALERMREVAIAQFLIRALSVPLIFLWVKSPGDGPLVIVIVALTGLVGGAAALFWIRTNIPLDWRWPHPRAIQAELFENGTVFLSRIWIVLYSSLVPTVLGVIAGPASVGTYVLADKICSAARSVLAPVGQALFPHMSYLFAHDAAAARRVLWRTVRLLFLPSIATSLALFLCADQIVLVAGGHEYAGAAPVLRWLSPLPLVILLSNIFGLQIMLPNQMIAPFNRILAGAGFLSLAMIAPLVLWRGAEGAAMDTLLAECCVTVAMAAYLYRHRFRFYPLDGKKALDAIS
jgi:PST family polysaccharide transporter